MMTMIDIAKKMPWLVVALLACGRPAEVPDAGDDAGLAQQDGGADAGSDEGVDGGADAGSDGGADGGSDAGADADAGSQARFYEGAERVLERVRVAADVTAWPACTPAMTAGCLYPPPLAAEVTEAVFRDDVAYVDVLGRQRRVQVAVYRAANAPRPAPLVVMSHGGADGITDATQALREWASVVAGAGYVVVSVAHTGYDVTSTDGGPSEYDELCAAVGVQQVPGFTCGLKLNWARPFDLDATLDWVEQRVATNAAWAEAVDLTRVAHLGHSAGAGAAMMVGGVTRNYLCAQPFGASQGTLVPCSVADLVSRRDTRFDAIVAFSPQGPGSDGFMDESYAALGVPMLMATGAEDGDVGEPANREALFPLLPSGPRWKVYLDDVGAQHGLFGGNLDPCLARATPARCAELRGALTAAALAFLDAHLRGRAAGTTWLDSGNLAAVSGGKISVTKR